MLRVLLIIYVVFLVPPAIAKSAEQENPIVHLSPATRGDSHQRIQFVTDSTKPISFTTSVINRLIHHSSTSFDADGITGWEDVSDINAQAASECYSAALTVK